VVYAENSPRLAALPKWCTRLKAIRIQWRLTVAVIVALVCNIRRVRYNNNTSQCDPTYAGSGEI